MKSIQTDKSLLLQQKSQEMLVVRFIKSTARAGGAWGKDHRAKRRFYQTL